MRISSKVSRRLGLGLAVAIVILLAAWAWLIPAMIVAAIRKHHDGHVAIRGWWINGSSAGVTGLTLREGKSPDSPAWIMAEAASIDLTIGKLLRGRFDPQRIVLHAPHLVYRIAADNSPLTRLPIRHDQESPSHEMIAVDARLIIRQEG